MMLTLQDVEKYFPVRGGVLKREVGRVHAVNGVTCSIAAGETVGIVGESGCGKSTLARLIMRLESPDVGTITLDGRPVSSWSRRDYYQAVQMVFQDPYSSLNPRMSVGAALEEMAIGSGWSKKQTRERLATLLDEVGLSVDDQRRYPHEFSGGQRQRIAIARALMMKPRLIVADEPISALDVTIQQQILTLLDRLRNEYQFSILFISHDLRTVARFCDRVAVMYLGKMVEEMPAERLMTTSRHPYVAGLRASLPVTDPDQRLSRSAMLTGEVPSPLQLPTGCAFHPRCPLVESRCHSETPHLTPREEGHCVSCHVV